MEELKAKILQGNVPKHVAIIMDGNGRWAKERGKDRIYGHMHGVESVREALTAAGEIGVKHLTLYAFSSENWGRPKEEVDALMELFVTTTLKELDTLQEKKVKLNAIGDISQLPESCIKALDEAKAQTANNDRIELILALSYSSKQEIIHAVKEIAKRVESGELTSDNIQESDFTQHLYTHGIPDPDFLIRTSGEERLSNFLLWQTAYTEFYFPTTMWPDFRKKDFFEAILHYQNKERRFGKTSEQITGNSL